MQTANIASFLFIFFYWPSY